MEDPSLAGTGWQPLPKSIKSISAGKSVLWAVSGVASHILYTTRITNNQGKLTLTPFFRADPPLYHKYGSMEILASTKLYSIAQEILKEGFNYFIEKVM